MGQTPAPGSEFACGASLSAHGLFILLYARRSNELNAPKGKPHIRTLIRNPALFLSLSVPVRRVGHLHGTILQSFQSIPWDKCLHRASVRMHRASVRMHQASVRMHQASVRIHRASVRIHRASVRIHRASVRIHRASVRTHRASACTHRASACTHRASACTHRAASSHAGLPFRRTASLSCCTQGVRTSLTRRKGSPACELLSEIRHCSPCASFLARPRPGAPRTGTTERVPPPIRLRVRLRNRSRAALYRLAVRLGSVASAQPLDLPASPRARHTASGSRVEYAARRARQPHRSCTRA